MENKLHVSAGGVIYQSNNHLIEIVLLYQRATQSWHLPKGTKERGETRRQTAIRETREETGILTEIKKYLGWLPSIYFLSDGTKIHKKTHYYLMKPIAGNFQNHYQEYDHHEFTKERIR